MTLDRRIHPLEDFIRALRPLRDLHGSLALLRDAAGKEDNLAYDEEAFKAAWAHSDINLTASEL